MSLRWLLAALVAVVLVGSTVELSCLASERLTVRHTSDGARQMSESALYRDAVQPDLPGVLEGAAPAGPYDPTYTR
jgi:hypothetical protein